MKTNQDYKNAALAALKGNWAAAVLATVVVMLVAIVVILPAEIVSLSPQLQSPATPEEALAALGKMIPIILGTQLAYYFLLYPLDAGYANATLRLLVAGENDLTSNTFRITFRQYLHKVWGMFLMGLFCALWALLFIIPGLVKAFSYAMTPYILEERPDLTANQAIDRSRAMMKGHKFDLFYLCLSFIGWGFLCILTLGIGFLWLIPYTQTSISAFYEDVKAQYEEIAMD